MRLACDLQQHRDPGADELTGIRALEWVSRAESFELDPLFPVGSRGRMPGRHLPCRGSTVRCRRGSSPSTRQKTVLRMKSAGPPVENHHRPSMPSATDDFQCGRGGFDEFVDVGPRSGTSRLR